MATTSSPHLARIALGPVAGPAALALYAFSGSLLPEAAWLAGWYGDRQTPQYLAPYVFMFGGIAQLTAAIWGFAARQWLTTAISGAWSLVHLAWGLLYGLIAAGVLAEPEGAFPGQGFWYIPLALFNFAAAVSAVRMSVVSASVGALGGTGASLAAAALISGSDPLNVVSGYVLLLTCLAGWYAATASLLAASFGRPVLPVGLSQAVRQLPLVDSGLNEPGVRVGA